MAAHLRDVNQLLAPQLAALPYYDGQEEPDSYYAKLRTINESARPLAVAGFNAGARANVMKGKMTGRFHPVPANNPYNGGAVINTKAEFLNWLQGKYREIMVGTNRDALRALMNEKFTPMDTADTYVKRVKPYVQGLQYAEALEYLYGHMPQYIEMRLRQVNPGNLDAFFTELRKIWLESRGRVAENISYSTPSTSTIQPYTDLLVEGNKALEFIKQLAKDLQYSGIATDNATLEKFIYEELDNRLNNKNTAHVRKSPFDSKKIYATKKVVKKVVKPKASSKHIRHCSACGKTSHTKANCPKSKRTKKVNYVHQETDETESEESEEETTDEETEASETGDDDDDSIDDRNCYALKKKKIETNLL